MDTIHKCPFCSSTMFEVDSPDRAGPCTENPKDKIGKTKPDISLVPPVAIIQEAVAMGLGAKKYGPYNWRDTPVRASVYISAAFRHLYQWLDGDNADPESFVSHLAHVRACCGIVMDAESVGKLVDDRPAAGEAYSTIQRLTRSNSKGEIHETHADSHS